MKTYLAVLNGNIRTFNTKEEVELFVFTERQQGKNWAITYEELSA